MNFRKFLKSVFYTLYKRHFYGITSPLRVLPDFIVIGVGRGGTTSLYHYLGQHPCIVPAAYDELGFFDSNFDLGLNWYRSLFPTIFTKKYIIHKNKFFMTYDVTPSYIRRPWVAKRISKILPHIKLIAILRNPVDRTYSHYNMGITEGSVNSSFEDVIKSDIAKLEKNHLHGNDYFRISVENSYLARGFYAEQLKIWYDLFPKEQLLVISTEDLALKPDKTLSKIFEFLKLPNYKIQNFDKQRVGNYTEMDPKTRQILVEYFKQYNDKLYSLIGKKLDWDK